MSILEGFWKIFQRRKNPQRWSSSFSPPSTRTQRMIGEKPNVKKLTWIGKESLRMKKCSQRLLMIGAQKRFKESFSAIATAQKNLWKERIFPGSLLEKMHRYLRNSLERWVQAPFKKVMAVEQNLVLECTTSLSGSRSPSGTRSPWSTPYQTLLPQMVLSAPGTKIEMDDFRVNVEF